MRPFNLTDDLDLTNNFKSFAFNYLPIWPSCICCCKHKAWIFNPFIFYFCLSVPFPVLLLCHNFKVFRSVIVFQAINMMHNATVKPLATNFRVVPCNYHMYSPLCFPNNHIPVMIAFLNNMFFLNILELGLSSSPIFNLFKFYWILIVYIIPVINFAIFICRIMTSQ